MYLLFPGAYEISVAENSCGDKYGLPLSPTEGGPRTTEPTRIGAPDREASAIIAYTTGGET